MQSYIRVVTEISLTLVLKKVWYNYVTIIITVCVCVCVQVYTCHSTNVGIQRTAYSILSHYLPHLTQGLLFLAVFARLTCKLPGILLSLPSISLQEPWNYGYATPVGIMWLPGIQTQVPNVCVTGTLSTESSLQPLLLLSHEERRGLDKTSKSFSTLKSL